MLIVQILAQAAAASTPEAAQQQAVLSYRPDFFAAFQPANASEMIDRVPGFILDDGADVRGYEGSAGNVLIDGERPATKSEDLEQVLRRIPASRVERIGHEWRCAGFRDRLGTRLFLDEARHHVAAREEVRQERAADDAAGARDEDAHDVSFRGVRSRYS